MKVASGLTTKEIADRSGLPEPTLEKLFAGQTKDPKLSTISQLVHFFGLTLDDLADTPTPTKKDALSDNRTLKVANQFYKLDEHGKVAVECITEVETARMEEDTPDTILVTLPMWTISDKKMITLPLLYQSRSAGTGGFADDETTEDMRVTLSNITRQANYLIRVQGDSMEPDFPDGCLVAVRHQEEVELGQVGVWVSMGDSYIKRRGKDGLQSINTKYPDMIPSKDTVCRGLVLGVVE